MPVTFCAAFWVPLQSPSEGTTTRSCADCESMSLTNGVFPTGASDSVSALGIAPMSVGRNDQQFIKYDI